MDCDERGNSEQHAGLSKALDNAPYAVMVLLGAAIIALGRERFGSAWVGAGAYVAYGVLGPLWIIIFLCPYCRSYGKRSCPSGYGLISAKLRGKGDPALFARKFRRHIPVIVPLWIIPPIMGGVAIANSFSWPLAILVGAFVLEAWVLLPVLSKRRGCSNCPQREACPWAGG